MSNLSEKSLYLPLPSALEAGVIDVGRIEPGTPQDASLHVSNGRMPDAAGLVELPCGNIGAFDFVGLVGLSAQDGVLGVHALPKQAVDGADGGFLSKGHVVFSTNEIVRPVAEVLPWSSAQWRDGFLKIGNFGIRHLGLEAPVYELTDVSSRGMQAQLPKRYF